ncbi:MAG: hypothetical protein NC253_12325 [Ruminococcus sp.]|nr:hypothetical protein [Ruminococcus sp.]MCM1380991.1 hypothetical protein [Muribaculaceae bacterium]MCM1478659.1 hypothetical protein [Muribaculaceae bacterium]
MKKIKLLTIILLCTFALTGCKNSPQEQANAAYENFLSGDVSLFSAEDVSAWGLKEWQSVLRLGGLKYAYLDLDGDGVTELIVQYGGVPAVFNGVFDYADGKLVCRRYDSAEGSDFDFPLNDGSMVRQYVFNGTQSYTVFRYDVDGEITEITNLFARTELIPEDSAEPCPYYEIDGKEVALEEFTSELKETITDKMLDGWTELN